MAVAQKVVFFVLLVVLVRVEAGFFKKKIEVKIDSHPDPEVTVPPQIDPRTIGVIGFLKGLNFYRKHYLFSHSLEFLGGKWNALLNVEINHQLPPVQSYYAEFMANSHNHQTQPGLIHGHVDREGNVPIFNDQKQNLTTSLNDMQNSSSLARFLKPRKAPKRFARELPATETFSKLDDSFQLENETASNETSTTTTTTTTTTKTTAATTTTKRPDSSTTLTTEAPSTTTVSTPNSTYGPPPLPDLTTSKPWNHKPYPPSNPTCGYHYGKPHVKDVDAIRFTTNDYSNGWRYGSHNSWQNHHYDNWSSHFRPSVPDVYRNMWNYHDYHYNPYPHPHPHPIRSPFARRRRYFK